MAERNKLANVAMVIGLLLSFFSFKLPSTAASVIEAPISKGYRTHHKIADDLIVFDNLTRLSPGGQHVAYVTAENLGMSDSTIWIASANGTNARKLAASGDGFWITNPVWSPDATQVAYLRVIEERRTEYEVDSRFEIWVVDSNGVNDILLIDDERLNPSLGYGGKTEITWIDDDVVFEDASVSPVKLYAFNTNTGDIRNLKASDSVMAPTSQPSGVPLFKQCDRSWGANQLGTCSSTICSHGCAITSVAMVFKYFGSSVDPGQLNSWLKNNSGYANGCDIRWYVAANYDSDITFVDRIWSADWARLNQELNAGYPVVADVGGHFLVVTHRSGDTYYVNDPIGFKTTLDSYTLRGLAIYHGPITGSCTDTQAPDGNYYSDKPQAGGWYDSNVHLKAWAKDYGGDCPSGVDEVLFRAHYNGRWHTVHSDGRDCSGTNTCDYEYTWDMDGVPDGDIVIGFDIRDKDGNWAYTPQGVRLIHKFSNDPPSISFNTANGNSANAIESRDRDWIFAGTASDSDGYISKIDFVCHDCDNSGSGPGSTTGNNWSLTRTGMSGRNEISFRAYDNEGASTESRLLDLIIDLAAPSTSYNLVGTMGENGWYTSPVEVRLHADDGSTGRARVGVNQIRYRLDGGSWQTHSGSDTSVTVSTDGLHAVEYYAVDDVDNTESIRSVSFKIDKTPPTTSGAITETHGAISGQWQKNWNDPAFTWGAASDTVSGLWYYQVDWADTLHVTSDAAYDPPAVRTGSYQLRVRAVDQAGNIGPEGPAFNFRYDGTPPHAPAVQNNDGIASGVWQNSVRTADFSWAVPHDEGSGVAGYNVYWGPSISGTNTSLTTSNSYVDATPICAEDEAAIHHLRVRSQDNVGWQSEWVAYSLAYDGAPPTATLVANYGMTVTNQTSVLLQILSDDEGSGVSQMRLSNDARAWSEWTDIAEQLHWEIPAIGRRMQPIYLQVVDSAGNISNVVSDTVYLEVNRARPKSESFWLWDDMMTSGGGVVTSTSYALRTSVGQSLDAPVSASASYKLISGFQAGVLAAPIETPGYTSYYQMGYVIAGGGTCTPTLQSATYQMYGTLGQPAHVLTVSSTSYTVQSGFWGGAGTDPAPPGSPPPPPVPTPPECEFYSVTINDDAPFTNSPTVSLDLCGPDPVEMMLSNDKYFTEATWQSYTRAISWTLDVSGSSVQSRFVYARFRDSEDEIHETFFDQIIYDPNASEGQAAFDPSDFLSAGDKPDSGTSALQVVSEETTDLFVSALDDSSGLAEMQVSSSPGFEGAAWEPYSAITPITFTQDGEQTIYVRFRDNAGNVSGSSSDSLLVDTTPPVGMANVVEGVVGPTAISATVAVSAVDDTSGVSEVRISSLESFTDTLWQPYVTQVAVPISYTGEMEPVLYVQFRDAAGNASLVYSTTYLVDIVSPLIYVDVAPGNTLTRTLTILAYDNLAGLDQLYLSNDPLMIDGLATMPYTTTVTWTFDERRVVWVQLEDSVGNVSEPYPAYAAEEGGPVYLPLILRDYSE